MAKCKLRLPTKPANSVNGLLVALSEAFRMDCLLSFQALDLIWAMANFSFFKREAMT